MCLILLALDNLSDEFITCITFTFINAETKISLVC